MENPCSVGEALGHGRGLHASRYAARLGGLEAWRQPGGLRLQAAQHRKAHFAQSTRPLGSYRPPSA